MRVATVLSDGFEDSEYAQPAQALRDAGHEVVVVGREAGRELTGKGGKVTVRAEMGIDEARPRDFDALFIPGGYSPDHLRADARFVEFTREMSKRDVPLLAICHGPQLLSAADAIRGRRLTAWLTVQDDLRRMGATVEDAEVVVDGMLVTSRKPDDIPAFDRAIVGLLDRLPAHSR